MTCVNILNGICFVPTSGTDKAICDFKYIETILKYKWHSQDSGNTTYAIAHSPTINGKRHTIRMHRLILELPLKNKAKVDHINHNGLDNRKENLRICSHQQNSFNMDRQKRRFSKYKGVTKVRKKYRAQIMLNGKGIHIGMFDTEEAAAKAYNRKALELFGQYATCNNLEV